MNTILSEGIESSVVQYRVITVGNDSSLFKYDTDGIWIHVNEYPNTDNHMEIILGVSPDANIIEYDKENQESLWHVQ